MRESLVGPRVLLRQLREVMAEPVEAQQRLNKIVKLIAANMVAEVCSIYVQRNDRELELFATEGLNQEAVHHTTMRVGEGLVGTIAKDANPMSLADAKAHPAFAYKPETGEEIFSSFLGVPVLRSGHTLGVLVVQNQVRKQYTEEEIEALQITSMVLAEMFATGEIETRTSQKADLQHKQSHHLQGLSLSEGIALGYVLLQEPKIEVKSLIAENIPFENGRLNKAIHNLRAWTDEVLLRGDVARGGEHREVFEAYRMLAHDRGWAKRMREAVASGLTAEAAVERVQSDTRARMMRQSDPYLRERLHDLDDLSNRLLRMLVGQTTSIVSQQVPKDSIIVARSMGPADLLDYDRNYIRGLVLEEGGPSSHVAIVARALGIPAVAQVANIADIADMGEDIIIDGEAGEVHLRPPEDVASAYSDKVRFQAERQAQYQKLRDVASVTKDGVKVNLLMNAGLVVELPHLQQSGANGIGLFRTELQFMMSKSLPKRAQQQAMYHSVLESAEGKPVVFRTLDIGGDKVLPYLRRTHEENPALGWRALRMALDRPGLLRTQVRALLNAAADRELSIMFPMVTDVFELRQAKILVEKEIEHLKRHNHTMPSNIRLGAMIEVPALLWQMEELLAEVDFVSIGSNDLLQFFWASDRGNTRLANRFDPLSPAVFRALKSIVEKAAVAKVPVTLCGELAGQPIGAMALIGIGLTSISMASVAIGPVKAAILELDAQNLQSRMQNELSKPAPSLRPFLQAYAEECNIPL